MQFALSRWLWASTLAVVGCAGCSRAPTMQEPHADAAAAVVSPSTQQQSEGGGCEAAVVDLVMRSEDVRAIVERRKTEHVASAVRTLPPAKIFVSWQVTLFEDPTTHAPLFPYFYVDPRDGGLGQRKHFDGNLEPLPGDPARAAAVVQACAPSVPK